MRELVPMSGTELNGAMHRLSPRETEICLMIRNGPRILRNNLRSNYVILP